MELRLSRTLQHLRAPYLDVQVQTPGREHLVRPHLHVLNRTPLTSESFSREYNSDRPLQLEHHNPNGTNDMTRHHRCFSHATLRSRHHHAHLDQNIPWRTTTKDELNLEHRIVLVVHHLARRYVFRYLVSKFPVFVFLISRYWWRWLGTVQFM